VVLVDGGVLVNDGNCVGGVFILFDGNGRYSKISFDILFIINKES
jgi:hypothetical protein